MKKGTTMFDDDPVDIPDELPPITPGGPPAPEWRR
jgi:hypothetical protein